MSDELAIDVEAGIVRIIAELLARPAAAITSALALGDDLGMKAIDLAELALEIEADFAVIVFTRPFADVRTVGDVVAHVEAALADPINRAAFAQRELAA